MPMVSPKRVDLLVHSAAQLATCAGPGPKRGLAMRDVGLLATAAVAITDGRIVDLGASATLRARYTAAEEIDATAMLICPGFVDPHTHVVYAGDRVDEFELRIQGATYLEIAAAGGGIASTMRSTRAASLADLVDQTRPRLDALLRNGTTTAEAKTGYGLDRDTELRQLQATAILDQLHPIDLIPTFLGAHALPPEYRGQADAYIDLVIEQMLPAALDWYTNSHFATAQTPFFVDVFCEQGAFDLAQSRRVLAAAHALGLPLKAHVDEFSSLGGVRMALEFGTTSLDHLDVTTAEDIALLAQSAAIAVVIPTVTFNLGGVHFANARALIDAGAAVALTTDINPGSAPCPSMPLAMAIACRYQHLTPAEALYAATLNAAHAIGLGDRIGSLEIGKQADLLIIDAPDYRHLAYRFGENLVGQVVKRGRVVHL
ncbi:MAG: imidazolonepropionase [Roseiflexaceae bacterium]|nr:imidazolonepropionase [Roseiflexaceae bacterium]